MYIIPITPATLDLIEVLNNGVRPEVENEDSFFIYHGKDDIPEIINGEEFLEMEGYFARVKIAYRKS